mmetsp:Transcript_19785/g.32080  ORF Transcript_19785/g.32080 Transcript_19785/m.32080 type:complete len:268 (+) Transcript_19785:81-884(+)
MLEKGNGGMFRGYGITDEASDRDVMRMFPLAFSMVSVFLFLIPAGLALRNDIDPVVHYWRHGDIFHYFLILIPIIIVAAHIYHANVGFSKYVTSAAAIVPGVILVIYAFNMGTTNPAGALFSIDCNIREDKANLQLEWEAASLLYKSCLQQTATAHNLTVGYLAEHFRIQDCTEYERDLRYHQKSWTYLQHLEETTGCTGFCIPGPPLWTTSSTPHKDSCSVAVAAAFKYMAAPHAKQILLTSLLTVVFVGVSVAVFVPLLETIGNN